MTLEEIEKRFAKGYEFYKDTEVMQLFDDMEWLINQAKKVEYLEKRKEEILVESGNRWTKLLKIQQILEQN